MTPHTNYAGHLETRRASLASAVGQHVTFGNLRLVCLAAVVAAAYAGFSRGLLSPWFLLVPVAAFVWAGARLDRAVRARARLGRSVAFYERALARLEARWAGTGSETGDRFLDESHVYARDLDLFGDASLFELVSSARTGIGEETLAAWLKMPAAPSTIRARQDAVVELAPRIDLREDLAVLGERAHSSARTEALAAWGERPLQLDAGRVPVWAWPLSVAGVLATLALFVWISAQLGAFSLSTDTLSLLRAYVVAIAGVCIAVVLRFRKRTGAILDAASEAADNLSLLADVLGRLEAERFTSPRLTALRDALNVGGQPPSRRIARLTVLIDLLDSRDNFFVRLFGPLVLWDLHLGFAIERWRETTGPALRRWLDAVGEIEALSSLAGYSYEHPDDVFPEFIAGPPSFDAEGLGHPLLAETVAVRNDVKLTGDLRVLVVSGSNMSGKSTLLRTVGINAVLAQAGAPVRAVRLRMAPLAIGASIHVQDSLKAGVSRFYAEITRLGSIMRHAGEAPPLLFLIDELLHGTNSHDRRIGAEAIVRGLVERGAIGLVTTHDLALAQVADALGARGANVHFQDELEAGRMRFDYRMRPGVVRKSNALELMRSVGLDV